VTLRERMAQHTELLCIMFGIAWDDGTPLAKAQAHAYDNVIHCPPVHGQRQYFTALHEIGHVVLGHHPGRWRRPRVEQEGEAWLWALDQAIIFPSPGTAADIMDAIDSYKLWAVKDRRAAKHVHGGLADQLADRLVPSLVEF
jgi:hypothetical protein